MRDKYIQQIREACINVKPIRLTDILVALRKSTIVTSTGAHSAQYLIDDKGCFHKECDSTCLAIWNLKQDDLRMQSEDTLAFLANILK